MKIHLIIPARYKSTRFPGKPLTDIGGKTMLRRVFDQCAQAFPAQDIYVATEDERIMAYCRAQQMPCVLTSDDCFTGTDRVAEAAELLNSDVCINVQGDEPLFNPEDIRLLVQRVQEQPQRVYAGYCEIDTEEMYRSLSVPKMVMDETERLLYTSRHPIPGNKSGGFRMAWRQVCAYAFHREALRMYRGCTQKTLLEQEEDLELLRFLEKGYPVQLVKMSRESIAVDHPEDVEKVLEKLKHV
jgi:3-deoxy-manno-octulosonate cytidylyltransferase (CMP-KDO synthetase)